MREIDLIPASYRAARRQTFWLKALAGIALGLVASTAAARIWLDMRIVAVDSDVASLQARQTITTAERDQLTALSETKQNYVEQLYLLSGLRSGATTTELFATIDDALIDDEVWFRSWEFRRAGVTNAEGQSIETGYFVVVTDNAGDNDTWSVETHMTIAGQALDHAALSRFVQRLLQHSEIENVHIRRTELQRFAARSLVDFDLAVVINRQVSR